MGVASLDHQGNYINRSSAVGSTTASGWYYAFSSESDQVVPNDTNGVVDVFLFDRGADGNGLFDEPN